MKKFNLFRILFLTALTLSSHCRATENVPSVDRGVTKNGTNKRRKTPIDEQSNQVLRVSKDVAANKHSLNRFGSLNEERSLQLFCRSQLRQCEREIRNLVDSCPTSVLGDQLFPIAGNCAADLQSCEELKAALACPPTESPSLNPTLNPTLALTTASPSVPKTISPTVSPSNRPTLVNVTSMPTFERFFQVPPNGTAIDARVIVVNDNFPKNLAWSINDMTNNIREIAAGAGLPNTTIVNITLTVGVEYEAIVTDNFGDGFAEPDGSFTISVVQNTGSSIPLVNVSGNYGSEWRRYFSVVEACNNTFLRGSTGDKCTFHGDCCTDLCFQNTCVSTCPTGYTLSSGSCVDIDECSLGLDRCGSTECVNTEGSFECFYQLPADGTKVDAVIKIVSDNFPEDYEWEINDLTTPANATYNGVGINGTTIINISLTVGFEYEAIIFDFFDDGFCCDNGSFEVLVDFGDGFEVPLVGVYGNYGTIARNYLSLDTICEVRGLAGFTGDTCSLGSECCSGACVDGLCGFCPPGFLFNNASSKCEDIDECALPNECSIFECVNSGGSYNCFYKVPAQGTDLRDRIDIDADDFPGDLLWTFNDLSKGKSIEGIGNDTRTELELIVGNDYTIDLFDRFGDGFCCPGGSFTISVDLGNGVYLPIDSINGNYGSTETLSFSVVDVCNDVTLLGYTGSTCSVADECCSGICLEGICKNGCETGFDFDGTSCVDINECATGVCASLQCLNTLGSYGCVLQLPSVPTNYTAQISVTNDFFPEEFSWSIDDLTNSKQKIYRGSGTDGNITTSIVLTSGVDYQANLEDDFGDGFLPGGSFILEAQVEGLSAVLVEVRDNYGLSATVPFSLLDFCKRENIVGNEGTICAADADCCSGRCLNGACFIRCSDGTELVEGFGCVDIDECELGIDECGPLTCINTDGSYQCIFPDDGTALPATFIFAPYTNVSWQAIDVASGVVVYSGDWQGSFSGPGVPLIDIDGIYYNVSIIVGSEYLLNLTDTSPFGGAAYGALALDLGGGRLEPRYEFEAFFNFSFSAPFAINNICEAELYVGNINPTCLIGEPCCSCTSLIGNLCFGDCGSGFDYDGTTCNDIDECLEGTSDCGSFECVNTIGSFQCLYKIPAIGVQLDGRIDIVYDFYPEETSWSIQDDTNGVQVAFGPENNGTQPGQTISIPIDLEVGINYSVIVRDSYGDGLCCTDGSFTILVELAPETDVVLYEVSGDFGFEASSTFSVGSLCEGDNAGSNGSACSTSDDCCSGVCSDNICVDA